MDEYYAPNLYYMWSLKLCHYKGCAIKESDDVSSSEIGKAKEKLYSLKVLCSLEKHNPIKSKILVVSNQVPLMEGTQKSNCE